MKVKMKRMIALTVLAMTIITMAQAQVNTAANYWVVEGNLKARDHSIVRIYDVNGNILHEEHVDGRRLDVRKRKDVKMLNRKLRDFDVTSQTRRGSRKVRKRPI